LRSELPYQDEIAMRGCIEGMLRRRSLSVADPWAAFVGLILRAAHKVEPQVVRQRMAEVSRAQTSTSGCDEAIAVSARVAIERAKVTE
jgi:hypothetical protein